MQETQVYFDQASFLEEKAAEHFAADRALVEGIRTELIEQPASPELVEKLYDVAREMTENELYVADPEGEVSGLLDSTRYYSRPHTFTLDKEDSGGYNPGARIFSLNLEHFDELAKEITEHLEARGITVKHPGDVKTFVSLSLAAHETGHTLTAGISGMQKEMATPQDVDRTQDDIATRNYLGHHPELGFTGNWVSDVIIHEERFAEGNAVVVSKKVLSLLGYNDEEIDLMSHLLSYDMSESSYNAGENQIDHIHKMNAATSASAIMAVVSGNKEMVKDGQEYIGYLGYLAPLTKEEMVSQLKEMDKRIMSRDFTGDKQTPVQWEKAVNSQQSEATKSLIAGIQARRQRYLDEAPVRQASPQTSF